MAARKDESEKAKATIRLLVRKRPKRHPGKPRRAINLCLCAEPHDYVRQLERMAVDAKTEPSEILMDLLDAARARAKKGPDDEAEAA